MKIILGLAGEIASGKGTIAKHVVKKYKGSTYRFSIVLRDVAKRMHLEENRSNLQKISTIFRKYFGEDILSKIIWLDVKKDKHKIIVIDGVRRLSDIKYLKKLPGFKLVYLEADAERCYKRMIKRGEYANDMKKTFSEFQKCHKEEADAKIKELKKHAKFFIENNGTLNDLYEKVDNILMKK